MAASSVDSWFYHMTVQEQGAISAAVEGPFFGQSTAPASSKRGVHARGWCVARGRTLQLLGLGTHPQLPVGLCVFASQCFMSPIAGLAVFHPPHSTDTATTTTSTNRTSKRAREAAAADVASPLAKSGELAAADDGDAGVFCLLGDDALVLLRVHSGQHAFSVACTASVEPSPASPTLLQRQRRFVAYQQVSRELVVASEQGRLQRYTLAGSCWDDYQLVKHDASAASLSSLLLLDFVALHSDAAAVYDYAALELHADGTRRVSLWKHGESEAGFQAAADAERLLVVPEHSVPGVASAGLLVCCRRHVQFVHSNRFLLGDFELFTYPTATIDDTDDTDDQFAVACTLPYSSASSGQRAYILQSTSGRLFRLSLQLPASTTPTPTSTPSRRGKRSRATRGSGGDEVAASNSSSAVSGGDDTVTIALTAVALASGERAAALLPTPVSLGGSDYVLVCQQCGQHELWQLDGSGGAQLAGTVGNAAPLVDVRLRSGDGEPQFVALAQRGRNGGSGSLALWRPCLSVRQELSHDVSEAPLSLWASRRRWSDVHHSHLLVSYRSGSTAVLSVGADRRVAAVDVPSIRCDVATLHYCQLGNSDASHLSVQLHADGFRQIFPDGTWSDWKLTSGGEPAEQVASNATQIAISVATEIFFFSLSLNAGRPTLLLQKHFDFGKPVCCLDLPSGAGVLVSPFFAVATADAVYIVSTTTFQPCCPPLPLPARPVSLCVVHTRGVSPSDAQSALPVLSVALQDGTLLRCVLSKDNGAPFVASTRSHVFERLSSPSQSTVRCVKLPLRGTDLGANSSSLAVYTASQQLSMLDFCWRARFLSARIDFPALHCLTSFSWPGIAGDAFVGAVHNSLQFISFRNLGRAFSERQLPLLYTPRRAVLHNKTGLLAVIETNDTDHDTDTSTLASSSSSSSTTTTTTTETTTTTTTTETTTDSRRYQSCVHLVDMRRGVLIDIVEFLEHEGATALCSCRFLHPSAHGREFIVVGTARRRRGGAASGRLHLFEIADSDTPASLRRVSTTRLTSPPTAACEFQGMLAATTATSVGVFELDGDGELLLKYECRLDCGRVVSVQAMRRNMLFVVDAVESLFFLHCDRRTLSVVATGRRPTGASVAMAIDESTVAGADRFGNVFVARLEPINLRRVNDSFLPWGCQRAGAAFRSGEPCYSLRQVAHMHVGDTVVGITRARFAVDAPDAIVYFTRRGAVGLIVPFQSAKQAELMQRLESRLRLVASPYLHGHQRFRASHFPVQRIVDGDLCETIAWPAVKDDRALIAAAIASPLTAVFAAINDLRPSNLSQALQAGF